MTLFAGQLYLNYTNSSRDIKAANLVYEEARFLMERIVREVRSNAIDYEEYFNQNVMLPYHLADGETDSYGDNYCRYSAYFYDDNGESIGNRNPTQKAEYEDVVGLDNTMAVRPIENELYLINISGNDRTIITRIDKDTDGFTIGKVAILQLEGMDFGDDGIDGRDSTNGLPPGHDSTCEPDNREKDGFIDTWHCHPDFPCKRNEPIDSSTISGCTGFKHLIVNDPTSDDHSFLDISPNAINVVDLKFLITPEDDPWKAYNINEVQIQPHVTIQLTAQANPVMIDTSNKQRIPFITLTSTISTRNYDEVNSDCR